MKTSRCKVYQLDKIRELRKINRNLDEAKAYMQSTDNLYAYRGVNTMIQELEEAIENLEDETGFYGKFDSNCTGE